MIEECVLAMQALPDQHIDLDIVTLGRWNIWMRRNDTIYNGIAAYMSSWHYLLKKDIQILSNRIKAKYLACLKDWIEVPSKNKGLDEVDYVLPYSFKSEN